MAAREGFALTDSWRCAQCQARHRVLGDCPPKCRGCGHHHEGPCAKLLELEYREQRGREDAEREQQRLARVREVAAEREISEADAEAALNAESEAKLRTTMADLRRKFGRPAVS